MKKIDFGQLLAILANIGVVAGIVFLAFEVRQSNVQARAAAYQAIGLATSQWHQNLDDRTIRLFTEANYPQALERWTLADWDRYYRSQLSGLRAMETVLLQVEQGLLDANAMDQLGYSLEGHQDLVSPALTCIWPDLRDAVGASLRSLIEETIQLDGFECQIDVQALRDQTIVKDSTR